MTELAARQIPIEQQRSGLWLLCGAGVQFTPRVLERKVDGGVTGALWDPAMSLADWQEGEFDSVLRRMAAQGDLALPKSRILELVAQEPFKMVCAKLLPLQASV